MFPQYWKMCLFLPAADRLSLFTFWQVLHLIM
jgi:hypothetical protein